MEFLKWEVIMTFISMRSYQGELCSIVQRMPLFPYNVSQTVKLSTYEMTSNVKVQNCFSGCMSMIFTVWLPQFSHD